MAVFGIRHLGLKVFAIGIAALLWVTIAGQQVVERAFRIPLEFTNLPRDLEMTGDTPTVVDVRVRGSSAAFNRIVPGELVAVLDLRSARRGHRLFHLTGGDVRVPFGIDVVQVVPSIVSMSFEPSATKTVPVVPALEGNPMDGFEVRTVSAEPAVVEVAGPAGALETLMEAMTEPISVAGASAPVRESVNIGVADPAVRLRTPQSAVVTVDIVRAPVDRTVSTVSVKPKGARAGSAALKPSRVDVAIRGSRELVDRLGPSELEAFVDVEGLAAGHYQLPVRVVAPAHVTIVGIDPARVNVSVR